MGTKGEKLEDERKRLVESLGVHFEKEKQVAPLAARIMATLVINGSQGTTFEQLVVDLEASKSTIFTHLNQLEERQWISHFTKSGDRKRYYMITPGYIYRRIHLLLTKWKHEVVLQKQIIAYKSRFNHAFPDNQYSLGANEAVLQFLTDSVVFFEKLTADYRRHHKRHNMDEL